MKKITIFLVLATLCLFTKLQSQVQIILTGQVKSQSTGQPLAGATVSIPGTSLSTITAENGTFSIKQIPPKGIVQISYTGYLIAKIPFNSEKNNLEINLESKDNALEEVQINAGYYTVKDKERTGTITKVSSETISNQPVSNPLAALQGRVAGLVITQRNGLPGSDFNVQLRGRNSIQSGTAPFYLIDGVPFVSETLAQNSSINANSPFNTISPSDIESIEVLKDADATAIYGSRGANGVILITTKKGKTGKTSAEINLSTGFGKITRGVELMTTPQYLEMRREAFANNNVSPTQSNAPDLLAWNNNRYTNFKDLLIGGTSTTQNAQIRLSGGNLNTRYSLGTNYFRETTVYPGKTSLQRKDANLQLNHKSADSRFSLNANTSYSINNSNLYNVDFAGTLTQSPNAPSLYDGEGKLNWSENGAAFNNPLARTLETNKFTTNRFTGNAMIGYKALSNLEIKATAGFNSINVNQYSNNPISAQNPASNPTGTASFGDNLNQSFIVEPQLNYELNLNRYGKFSLLLGGTWQQTDARGSVVRGTGYTSDLLLGSIEAATTKVPSNTFSEYKYQAVYARVNYNLMDRYFINFTGRRDGSSRFGPGRQFANFGAVGAAWLFSEEEFLKDKVSFLSLGKIRGSYGLTGNDQINNYQYLDSYSSTLVYGTQSGLIPTRLFNKNYGWEENQKLEAALELGFFNDRIRMSAGYFRNLSGNQLVSYSLPSQTGFTSILRNLDAKIENQGYEFEVNTSNLKSKNFRWSTSFNLTVSKNKLLEFPGLSNSSYANTYIIGEPLSIVRGYHYLGISQTTGAYQFEDKNGDGLVNSADYYNIGTKDPSFYGGLQNSFQYKSISLDVFFQFVKQKGTDMVYGSSTLVGINVNVPQALTDRWSPTNPGAKYQAYSQSASGPVAQARSMITTSDAALVDASYIRLKNVSLSYHMPKKLTDLIHIGSARFYAQGQNLVTFTNYLNLDPESQSISVLPPLKVFSIGLQINL